MGCPESVIYDTQVAYARLFLERLEARIDLNAFPDGIEYVFAQVAKISLRKQTDIRFGAYKSTAGKDDCFKKFGDILPVTTLSYLSGADIANWAKLWHEVKIHPRKLYVVFQDEAHYGAKEGSTASVQVADKIQHFANAVHVCITATPYAIIPPSTAKDGTDNVVPWSAPPAYYDYARLKKEKHVDIIENCCAKFGKSCARGVERDVMMTRYEAQLLQTTTTTTTTTSVKTSLRDALAGGQKIIIRARNDKDLDVEGRDLEERFNELLMQCGLGNKKATLVEADPKGENLANSFSSPDVAVIIVKQMLQMGDTFPRDPTTNDPIIAVYDESLQYHGDNYVSGESVNYDKIHQELGRAFGYYPNSSRVTRLVVTAEIDRAYKPPMSAESYYDRIANGETFSPRMGITAIAALDDTTNKHIQTMATLGITQSDRDNYHFSRLFVLWAQPQSGKTGAVLWLMKLIAERFGYIGAANKTTATLHKKVDDFKGSSIDDSLPTKADVATKKKVGDGAAAQCAGITASGSQCSRKPKAGSTYCFQHDLKASGNVLQSAAAASSSTEKQHKQQPNTPMFVFEATLKEGMDILRDMEIFEDKQMYVALESNHSNPVFPGEDLVTLRLSTGSGGPKTSSPVVRLYVTKPFNTTKYRLDSHKAIECSDKCTQSCVKLLPLLSKKDKQYDEDAFADPSFITSILQSHRYSSSSSRGGGDDDSMIGISPSPSDNGVVWMQLDHVGYVKKTGEDDTDNNNLRQLKSLLKTASGGTVDIVSE